MGVVHNTLAEMRPLDILQNWVWGGGAPWFDRRLFFLNKFYNANAMPLGIILCFAYFLMLLMFSQERHDRRNSKIDLIVFGLVILASCVIYPPLAIIPLLHTPIWIGSNMLFKRVDFKTKIRESLVMLIPFITALVTASPYLLSVSGDSGESPIRLALWDQSIRNIFVFLLPAPFILYGIWIAIKKLSSQKLIVLLSGTLLCFGLSTFTRVALWNSGKFTFILSFFYAFYFLYATSGVLDLFSHRRLKRMIITSLLLFLLFTPVLTEISYTISPWFRDNEYSFSGRHIIINHNRERNEVYAWIRSNTPPEALIMLTYVETTDPDEIAQNSTYEPAALSERNLFVIRDAFTRGDPEYTRRTRMREQLFVNYRDPVMRDFFTTLNRPVYLLVEERLGPLYLRDEWFGTFSEHPVGFKLLFQNEGQRVYLMRS
jgi:hypothetical protein